MRVISGSSLLFALNHKGVVYFFNSDFYFSYDFLQLVESGYDFIIPLSGCPAIKRCNLSSSGSMQLIVVL